MKQMASILQNRKLCDLERLSNLFCFIQLAGREQRHEKVWNSKGYHVIKIPQINGYQTKEASELLGMLFKYRFQSLTQIYSNTVCYCSVSSGNIILIILCIPAECPYRNVFNFSSDLHSHESFSQTYLSLNRTLQNSNCIYIWSRISILDLLFLQFIPIFLRQQSIQKLHLTD